MPVSQFPQAKMLLAPVVAENVPAAHSVHIAAPVVSENLPASQSEHVVARINEYLPGMQVLHVLVEGAA